MLQDTEETIERVAALDIGKAELVACIRVPNPERPGRRAQEISTYSTMTRSLLMVADRLLSWRCPDVELVVPFARPRLRCESADHRRARQSSGAKPG